MEDTEWTLNIIGDGVEKEKLNFDISESLKQFLIKLTNEINNKIETDVSHNEVTYIWVNP